MTFSLTDIGNCRSRSLTGPHVHISTHKHIRCFRSQAKNRESGCTVGREAVVTSAALHDIAATIRAHADACLEFTTSELRLVVLCIGRCLKSACTITGCRGGGGGG